jgi:hypothetical protein
MDCNRCGGCGQFSYNDVDGTRCYGCAGSGWQYTPKGKREFKKWQEAVRAFRATKISDVRVGDRIVLTRGQSTQREFAEVLEVERQLRSADESPWSSSRVNGELVFESRERTVLSVVFKSGFTGNYVFDQPEHMAEVSRGKENEPQPDEYVARALSTKVKK